MICGLIVNFLFWTIGINEIIKADKASPKEIKKNTIAATAVVTSGKK